MTVQEQSAIETISLSGIFDVDYYSSQAKEKFATKEAAIAHYLEKGWAHHYNPHPLFDTRFYLEKNPDVSKAQVNPLVHFITLGGFENRKPCEHFDGYFYISENPDVKALKVNPLAHFISTGAAEGRNPSAAFDTTFYLQSNPGVKSSGENALAHWIIRGRSEGKRSNARPDYPESLYLRMRQLEPLLPKFLALTSLRESKESFVSNAGLVYDKLKIEIHSPFSHLFVVGNSPKSLNTAAAFLKSLESVQSPPNSLVVVTGRAQPDEQAPIDGLQKYATVAVLQNFGKKLQTEEEARIVCRLAIQAEPQVIHAINSIACLDLFRRLHRPLSLKSKLFASVHSFSHDAEGIPDGPNLRLSPCADSLSAIFVESTVVREELLKQIGFDRETSKRIAVQPDTKIDTNTLKNFGYLL